MTCDCGATLVVSPNQSRCAWADEPGHGEQTWWDCPQCGASWEDEEL